jgi:hypothetical protein
VGLVPRESFYPITETVSGANSLPKLVSRRNTCTVPPFPLYWAASMETLNEMADNSYTCHTLFAHVPKRIRSDGGIATKRLHLRGDIIGPGDFFGSGYADKNMAKRKGQH